MIFSLLQENVKPKKMCANVSSLENGKYKRTDKAIYLDMLIYL